RWLLRRRRAGSLHAAIVLRDHRRQGGKGGREVTIPGVTKVVATGDTVELHSDAMFYGAVEFTLDDAHSANYLAVCIRGAIADAWLAGRKAGRERARLDVAEVFSFGEVDRFEEWAR